MGIAVILLCTIEDIVVKEFNPGCSISDNESWIGRRVLENNPVSSSSCNCSSSESVSSSKSPFLLVEVSRMTGDEDNGSGVDKIEDDNFCCTSEWFVMFRDFDDCDRGEIETTSSPPKVTVTFNRRKRIKQHETVSQKIPFEM